jgi:hypothetical protein
MKFNVNNTTFKRPRKVTLKSKTKWFIWCQCIIDNR